MRVVWTWFKVRWIDLILGHLLIAYLISITLVNFFVDEFKVEGYHKIFQISSVKTKNRDRFKESSYKENMHHLKRFEWMKNWYWLHPWHFLKHMIVKIYVETVYPPKIPCAHLKNRGPAHLRNFLAFIFYKRQSRVDMNAYLLDLDTVQS